MAGGPLHAFAHALRRALDADPRWVIGGAIFELLSFAGYVALFWMVGSRATKRLGLRESTQVTLGGAAATRLLPTAGVGGAAMTLWALRRAGLGSRGATRTLLGFLIVLYSIFLGAIALSGGLIALGLAPGDGPLALSAIPAAAATLAIVAALALGARRPGPRRARAGRLHAAADVFGGAVRDAIGHVRSADPRLLGAIAWWTFDAAVLWAMLNAFGAAPPFAVVVLAYFVGQVGNTIPIPGAVSGGIVGVLVAFGGARRPRAHLGARLPRDRHLAARADRPGRPRLAAPHDGALERRGRSGRAEPRPPPAPRRAHVAPVPRARAAGRMRLRPATSPALPAPPARVPRGLLVVGVLAAAAFALVTAGVVRLPDVEGFLTDLSDTLGPWTYALVAALAFLETGAFVGLVAPGETAIVLGGVVAAEGGVDLGPIILVAWLAAALGDLASFALGQRLGRRFLVTRGPRFGITRGAPGQRRGASSTATAPRRSSSGASSASCARSRRSWPGRRACACAASCPGACSGRRCGRPPSRSSATPSTSPSPPPRTR